jgi:hypothetical protein
MGAELREVKARRMSGLPRLSPQEAEREAWATLVTNLRKRPKKESALDLLEQTAVNRRATTQSLQRALLRHEMRELAGRQATTVRQRQTDKAVRQTLPQIAAGLASMAAQQALTVQQARDISSSRVPAEWTGKNGRTASCRDATGRHVARHGRIVIPTSSLTSPGGFWVDFGKSVVRLKVGTG